MKITPNQILYINLGLHNEWRKDCIYTENTIRLGHIEVSHQICLECKSKDKWNEVEEELKKYFDNKIVTRRKNEIRHFYLSDENTLWINFSKDNKLWWCFAKTNITLRADNTKERAVIGKWNCNNILGEPLELKYFNEEIQKSRCNQTICCKDKYFQEIVESINAVESQQLRNNIFEDYPNLKNEREEIIIQIIKRYQDIVLKIKNKYNNCCQFEDCGFTFKKNNGIFYSEAHHLIPLSEEGSQNENNIVIVCPNHHRILHYAQVEIKEKENNKRLIKINEKDYFIIYK